MGVVNYRRLTVGMVIALIAVGVLAGVGPAFPRDEVAGTSSWRFLATNGAAAAHASLGIFVLVGAALLAWFARRRFRPSWILLGTGVSVTAGFWYVQAQQPEAALTAMTFGWLVALAASVAEVIGTRRRASTSSSATGTWGSR